MTSASPIPFDNSYARLPERFYSPQAPEPVSAPESIRVNRELAARLGVDMDWLLSRAGIDAIAGNALPEGAQPIATVYAGHQFGHWNPQLGDGRAVLLGEVIDRDGARHDIQLKGSGRTPYSRMGDGRSPLGPVLREYILSEAMTALGVPSTRALAAVTTGEPVHRERTLPGAVLVRVARSHIRVGTVQFFASREDTEGLRLLARHVMERHFPQALDADNPALAMLEAVVAGQAALIARWQLLGFIHGVMNTDNMLLGGETVDYGPCAFMDAFNPNAVFSSIDHGGRYAYCNQPGIAHWNLAALAQALLPILHEDGEQAAALAQGAVDRFGELFADAWRAGMGAKLGLAIEGEADEKLAGDLLALMAQTEADFTLAFRRLADLADPAGEGATVQSLFDFGSSGSASSHESLWEGWLTRWRERIQADPRSAAERQASMYRANPAFIPRNHLVEEAIAAAQEDGDFEPFNRLVDVLARPFDYREELARYTTPPRPEQVVRQTFCGT